MGWGPGTPHPEINIKWSS